MKVANQSSQQLQTNEDENMSVSGVSLTYKRGLKNNINSSNTKRITMTKKIENVEYLIKIEQKNKRQLEEKYTKQIYRLENQIEKLEKELESTLRELNEKEAKIFEIQKNKLETFKHEIRKYENVYMEIEEKSSNVGNQIEDSIVDEQILYNQSNMVLEDYLSYNNEILYLKQKVIELKENLREIEKTYPKEFEFLLEDIELEKDINEISTSKKGIQEEVEKFERSKKELTKIKEMKKFEMINLIEEIKKNSSLIELSKKDNHLAKLEEHIFKNISDMLIFEKMKILIQNYYTQKNFDLENELNVLLIKNLNEKLKEMKNEFVSIRNEKLMNKSKLEKIIEDLIKILSKTRPPNDKTKIEKDINFRQTELERLNNEISILELNCKKKETLFNKYIIVLRNKCKKSTQESYYEMNPALVIENEFEEKFKEEMIRLIDNDQNMQNEDKIKNKNIIEIYFKELINREKVLQAHMMKKRKCEDNVISLTKEIEKIEESFIQCEVEISNKKYSISEIITKEKVYLEKIEMRNRNLTGNLEQMGEGEFEKYLKSNDGILKNMKKVYGNKILDKVFKVQKQKILENVIMDHSYKKGKVNEYISLITRHESNVENYNNNLSELETNYKFLVRKYEGVLDFKENKFKEKKLLGESKNDLQEKMEMILHSQIKEIENEKKQLQFKFNVNYYIEKIKDLSEKVSEASNNKETMCKEYEDFSNIINEKEQKLYIEDLDLKNNMISLSMRNNDDNLNSPNTIMPYKVNKSYESGRKIDYNSSNDDEDINTENNFDEIIKKSVDEYNIKGESILKEDNLNLEEINRNDEDNKKDNFKINSNVSYNNANNNLVNKDPFLSITIEKIKPLASGLSFYKKFNNNSMTGKTFDPNQPGLNPENCGYALRLFKINIVEEILEVKNPKSKHIEAKIGLNGLKGIMLGSSAKTLIKLKRSSTTKPNQEINKLISNDFIPFTLLYQEGNMELIAPNFQTYKTLEGALEEILKYRKNLNSILKYIDQ